MTEEEGAALDIKFQQRFSKNLISNVVYFVLNVIIGLALVPFFLDTLGEAAYGLVPLATSLTSYVTLVIDAMNGAISRYLTIELQRGDITKANETFNTAIFGTLGIILLLTPIALFIAWLAPSIFQIGEETPFAVFLLFALIFLSVLIRAWSSNFMVTLFALNRLELRNTVNCVNLVVQVMFVVILFVAIGPSLPFVGLSYLIASVVACSFAFILSRRLCPYLNISPKFFDRSRFKELGSMSLWLLVTILGVLLRSQVALIIINILFGEISGTEYSLALMWFTLLVAISGLITNCFTPMIYSYRAKEDKEGLVKFTSLAIKASTFLMVLPIGLVCIFAPQLLTLWVGDQYAHLAPLVWILVVPVVFLIQSACCTPINAAYKRVRGPALIHVISGPFNIVLALLIPFIFNNGMYGVGISVGIITFIVAGLYSPMYNAYVVGMPLTTFMKPAIPGYAAFCLLGIAGVIISIFIPLTDMTSIVLYLIIAGCLISAIYLILISKFGFKNDERRIIRTVLPASIAKHIPHWLF